MWAKQCHKSSPSHHYLYKWCVYHSQSWVVYGIVSTTLIHIVTIDNYRYIYHIYQLLELCFLDKPHYIIISVGMMNPIYYGK